MTAASSLLLAAAGTLIATLAASARLHAADGGAPTPIPPASADRGPAGFEVESRLNVAYRDDKDADPERHKLDLYLPKGAKDFPLLVFVHGGSWSSGHKGLYAPLGAVFARNGIGVAVPNYRLSPKVKHPAHIEDVAKAVAWVADNAARLGARTDGVVLSGHSAGGHLVSLLATDERYLKAERRSAADVAGVIAISGVYEIFAGFPLFHSVFGRDEVTCRAASPLAQVRAGKLPPFLLIYAENDFPTCDRMTDRMAAALKKAGTGAETMMLKDRNHVSIILGVLSATDPLTTAMLDFVKKRGK